MTKNEILEGLHQRIENVIAGGPKSQNDLGLKKILNDSLTESKFQPEIVKVLEPFDVALNENVNQLLLVRPLLETLSKYSALYKGIGKNCGTLKSVINEHLEDINLYELYESIENPDIKNFVGVNFNSYMTTKTLESKSALVGVLESASGYDNSAMRLLGYLQENKITGTPNVVNIYESVNESEVIDFQGQKFIQTSDGKLHNLNVISQEQIFEAVDEYVEEQLRKSKEEKESINESKDYRLINSELHLYEHVMRLQKKYPDNANLQSVLNEYASALQAGCREEMIFETFVQRLHEGFDYLNDVEVAINNIKEAAKSHKHHIDFVKVFEAMANSSYAYLIPVIEGVVYDFVKTPNPQTRNILLNQLRMYESCPQVVAMMMYANEDESVLSEGFNAKDRNQFIRQNAHTESVFSPVQYIRENECIFSVENKFYVKKGNNITKLSKDAVKNLSESFIALSILVNDPNVEINEHENTIKYHTVSNTIEISEKFAKINESYESLEDLKSVNEMHIKYPEMDDVNILTTAFLLENFNNIAKIDFVTKIAMNENENKTLDLFKIKDNIFVASHDNINEEHTFYRNVKPLQLKNIINNHFGLNVSNLFEDLMPNQDKIMNELNEIKNEFENKITSLLEMKQEFETILESAEGDTTELETSIKELEKQINEAKKDYKKFQKKTDEIENGKDSDNDGESNVLNEKTKGKKSKKKVNEEDEEDFIDNVADDSGDVDNFDLDGSDSDFDADFDVDGSDDFEMDGSDDFDWDGSDIDWDSSDEINDDFTTSDGDDMTQSISDNNFETDPFDFEDGSDGFDYSDMQSQDGDYSLDGETDEFGEPIEQDAPEVDLNDESVLDADDDPFGTGLADTEDSLEGETGTVEDAVSGEPEQRTEPTAEDADLDYANFKIVKVDFDVNVRTGERKSTGKAIVVVPWIDDFGNKTSETKTIPFYITDIQGEKGVVLDTTGMTVEMYNAVTDAIKKSNDFQSTESQSNDSNADAAVVNDADPSKDFDVDNANQNSVLGQNEETFDPMGDSGAEPFDSGSDETTVLTIDDGIEPHGVDVNTYQSGDTEIELPANNISMGGGEVPTGEIADKSSEIIDIVGESKKSPKGKSLNESAKTVKNDPYAHLFESVAAQTEEMDKRGEGSVDLVTAENQEDPIAVVEDVLNSFAEEMGLSEDEEETLVEVGEIEDFDIDGTDVSSIKATIGENEYAFFTYGNSVYSCLAEDFDEYSEDIESLEEFIDSDNENLAEASTEDVHDIVDLVTDVISIETGEDFEYNIEGDEIDDESESLEENPEFENGRNLEEGNF